MKLDMIVFTQHYARCHESVNKTISKRLKAAQQYMTMVPSLLTYSPHTLLCSISTLQQILHYKNKGKSLQPFMGKVGVYLGTFCLACFHVFFLAENVLKSTVPGASS